MSTPDRIALEHLAQTAEAYVTSEADVPTRLSLRREFVEALNGAWDVLRPTSPEPWRFDVPAIPDSVTCLIDAGRERWIRVDDHWLYWDVDAPHETHWALWEMLAYAPLVEHPDPRSTT